MSFSFSSMVYNQQICNSFTCSMSYATLLVCFYFITSIFVLGNDISTTSFSHQILQNRLEKLSNIVSRLSNKECFEDKKVLRISEESMGNGSKHIVQFVNGLWLSKNLSYTFIIPTWMESDIKLYNLSLLNEKFCFSFNQNITGRHVLTIRSKALYILSFVFTNRNINRFLPKFSDRVLSEISDHYLAVYAGLWAYPPTKITSLLMNLVNSKFNGNFEYTSIHKRSFKGACTVLLYSMTKPEEYISCKISMLEPGWLDGAHPLCEMSTSFIKFTEELNGRRRDKRYIYLSDENLDDSGTVMYSSSDLLVYSAHDLVLGLDHNNIKNISMDDKFLIDIFVSANGDFFILNPYSTVSWTIYMIRVALGLESVPVLQDRDLFFQKKQPNSSHPIFWVNWISVKNAYDRIKFMI